MHLPCPPHKVRYCARLLLPDGQVLLLLVLLWSSPTALTAWYFVLLVLVLPLLVLPWSSQAVDNHLLLVLLVLQWSSQAVDNHLLLVMLLLLVVRCPSPTT